MNTLFERIVIEVSTPSAIEDYATLLGVDTVGEGLFLLGNTTIALEMNTECDSPRIARLVLARPADELPGEGPVENSLGMALDQVLAGGEFTVSRPENLPAQPRVDHLVVRTNDPEGCIRIFRDELGMRLALDQQKPEWGGRMLFFRSGKLTLEVIAPLDDPPADTHFWGITYQCADIEAMTERLRAAGVSLSEVRQGRKPGTRVATVKSHCLGLPTLLLQSAPAD